ncbi:putative transcription factor interactor and regulator CCHC(Zn) family [Rosa chinensis]|uniref:Putative transcription factor interactor and regulator CCHC(Zn) family n=1 Tax=Rosa chinensis TaxID=74649 RepID=A0A2P6QYE3_ROSCH|nr:putative transcription factor interactor and regulator CCHC(Zn) family [Rosa chinensis]
MKITRARNQLDALGVRMEDQDIVVVLLNGLPAEFNLIKAIIRARKTPITMQELRIQLLAAERDIANRAILNIMPAFSVRRTKKNVSQRCLNGNRNDIGSMFENGGGYWNNFGLSPECQICRKRGHTAAYCFYRNDIPPDNLSNSVIICQICGLKGHAALDCHHKSNFALQGAEPSSTLAAMTVHNTNGASTSGASITAQGFSYAVSLVVVDGGDQNVINNDQVDAQLKLPREQFDQRRSQIYEKSMLTKAKGLSIKKKTFRDFSAYSYIAQQKLFDEFAYFSGFTSALDIHDAIEPKTFKTVVGKSKWDSAMNGETNALKKQEISYRHNGVFIYQERYAKDFINGQALIKTGIEKDKGSKLEVLSRVELSPNTIGKGGSKKQKSSNRVATRTEQVQAQPQLNYGQETMDQVYNQHSMLTRAKHVTVNKLTFQPFQDFCALIDKTSMDTSTASTQSIFTLLEKEGKCMICYFIMFLLLSILQLLSILKIFLLKGYTSSIVSTHRSNLSLVNHN